tara:strand:+ start:55 stop:261 length:207 start_codon:yes stop_codon:yes gene_type:complete
MKNIQEKFIDKKLKRILYLLVSLLSIIICIHIAKNFRIHWMKLFFYYPYPLVSREAIRPLYLTNIGEI